MDDKTPNRLPTYEEAAAAVKRRKATALEQFIYDNEPAGREAEKEFRSGLAAVVLEAQGG